MEHRDSRWHAGTGCSAQGQAVEHSTSSAGGNRHREDEALQGWLPRATLQAVYSFLSPPCSSVFWKCLLAAPSVWQIVPAL